MRGFKSEVSRPESSGSAARAFRRRLPPSAFRLLLSAFCLLPSHAAAASWSKQKSGTFAWLHAVYFLNERYGWAGGGKGALLSTEDGGATWRRRSIYSEDTLRDIFFVDGRHGWVVCERDVYRLKSEAQPPTYLMRTTDGGRTWSRVEPDAFGAETRLVGVRFAGRERGWVFGELGALYATADGGRTWVRQVVPTRRLLLGAAFLDAQHGWVVGAGATLLRTTDGGRTWHEGRVAGQLAQYARRSRANRLGRGDGTARRPAAAAGQAPRVNAVAFADGLRGWAVGAGGLVLATSDGGRTWQPQESGVETDLHDVKFLDGREGWAVGGEGIILHTADGGATWSADTSVTPHTLERLFFAGRARGWAVGFGGTIVAFGERAVN
ncbi:MAG TPA: YCF48-related protein [Pyrinomonadaceae bacterium]|nr:YCF48-related protein [Pyrinomonadaceae bacterium]